MGQATGPSYHAHRLCLCFNEDRVHICVCCNPGSAQQALQTPQTMLDEVVWCLSDPPQQARLDTLHAAAPFARCGACKLYARHESLCTCWRQHISAKLSSL